MVLKLYDGTEVMIRGTFWKPSNNKDVVGELTCGPTSRMGLQRVFKKHFLIKTGLKVENSILWKEFFADVKLSDIAKNPSYIAISFLNASHIITQSFCVTSTQTGP
jgi:hypothetical protein